jgi:uncharacterized protein YjbI with pentapeptide repeats
VKGIGMGIPKDFSYLDLNGRDFIQAKMFGANLSGADLGAANLRGVNLTDADLTDAKLVNVTWPTGWKLVRDE